MAATTAAATATSSSSNSSSSSSSGAVATPPRALRGRALDRWLLDGMCPPAARHTFGLPAAAVAGPAFAEAAGRATGSATAGRSSGASGQVRDALRPPTASLAPRTQVAPRTPMAAGPDAAPFVARSSAASRLATAADAAAAANDEAAEAAAVQAQLLQEHAALEGERAAGELDAVLATEAKMRAVAEVMALFRCKIFGATLTLSAISRRSCRIHKNVKTHADVFVGGLQNSLSRAQSKQAIRTIARHFFCVSIRGSAYLPRLVSLCAAPSWRSRRRTWARFSTRRKPSATTWTRSGRCTN